MADKPADQTGISNQVLNILIVGVLGVTAVVIVLGFVIGPKLKSSSERRGVYFEETALSYVVTDNFISHSEDRALYKVKVDETKSVYKNCGPYYGNSGPVQDTAHPYYQNIFQLHWTITVLKVPSGQVLGTSAFDGPAPHFEPCPDWIDEHDLDTDTGSPNITAIQQWIAGILQSDGFLGLRPS